MWMFGKQRQHLFYPLTLVHCFYHSRPFIITTLSCAFQFILQLGEENGVCAQEGGKMYRSVCRIGREIMGRFLCVVVTILLAIKLMGKYIPFKCFRLLFFTKFGAAVEEMEL